MNDVAPTPTERLLILAFVAFKTLALAALLALAVARYL
jgi:hypothetical protein